MGQLTKDEVFALAVQRYSDAVYRAAYHNCSCTASAKTSSLVNCPTSLTLLCGPGGRGLLEILGSRGTFHLIHG